MDDGVMIVLIVLAIIVIGIIWGLIMCANFVYESLDFNREIKELNSDIIKSQNCVGSLYFPNNVNLKSYPGQYWLSTKRVVNQIKRSSIAMGNKEDLIYLNSICSNKGPYGMESIIATKEEISRCVSRIHYLDGDYSKFGKYTRGLEEISPLVKQERINFIISLDSDSDGAFGFNDWLRYLRIPENSFRDFYKGLFLVNDDIAFIIPSTNFKIKIGPELVDVVKYCGRVPFNMAAHYIYGILDVNTDGFISITDDVNQDNCIDKRDFDDIRRYRKNLVNKFGTDMDQCEITLNDIIFERYFIVKNSEFSKAMPSANLFKPYFYRSSEFSEPVVIERHLETNTTSDPGVLGVGIGAGLGGLLFGPLGAIAGGLLGAGLDSVPVETTNEYETIEKIEYITTKTEKQEPVLVCIVTCINGYKVFFFDASHVMTEVEERQIVEQHINGQLVSSSSSEFLSKRGRSEYSQQTSGGVTVFVNGQLVSSPSSEFISKRAWSEYSQKTSGRITVLDPKRDLRASFDKNGLAGIFYTRDGVQVDGVVGKALEKDFNRALISLINGPLSKLNGLVYSLHHFNGSNSLYAQDKYLNSLDNIRFSNPECSLLESLVFYKASNH